MICDYEDCDQDAQVELRGPVSMCPYHAVVSLMCDMTDLAASNALREANRSYHPAASLRTCDCCGQDVLEVYLTTNALGETYACAKCKGGESQVSP